LPTSVPWVKPTTTRAGIPSSRASTAIPNANHWHDPRLVLVKN
jgi:hypothetical protein